MIMNRRFSVIVPIFEQWHLIPELLECLLKQSFEADKYEVLLVDNGSEIVSVPESMPSNVRVLHCEVRGAYAARNHGVEHAQGDWLVFTDSDCLPSEDWLCEIDKAISDQESRKSLFAGDIEVCSRSESPTIYEIYDIVRGIPQAHYVRRGYAATANLSVSREVANALNGFNDRLYSGGDADFCRRAGNFGCDIVHLPFATVEHRVRVDWESIATKARRVKGGQLTCKSPAYKAWIFCRTFFSPAITAFRLWSVSSQPRKYRFVAIIVYMKVWLIEVAELFRVSFGKHPERR